MQRCYVGVHEVAECFYLGRLHRLVRMFRVGLLIAVSVARLVSVGCAAAKHEER